MERASKDGTGEFIEEDKQTKKSNKDEEVGDDDAAAVDAIMRDLKNKEDGNESSEDEKMVIFEIKLSK